MAKAKKSKMIYYTVPEHADSLLVEVDGRKDTAAAREKALRKILTIMENDDDDTLKPESFPNGLSPDQLVVVDPPDGQLDGAGEGLAAIEVAAAEIAQFGMMRVKLQEQQTEARPLLSLIEALFQEDPLTEEQMVEAKSKKFAKNLQSLAKTKVEYDAFRDQAEEAWVVLRPVIAGPGQK